jgi:putative flippase GtrA
VSSLQQLWSAGEPWRRILKGDLAPLRTDAALAQAVRFAISGVIVSIVYITVTTLLAEVSHLRFQLALAIGWCSGVSVHYTLQRVFVWAHRDGFALPFARQIRRYLLLAFSQLAATTASTSLLPSALGVPAEAVYLASAAILTMLNFIVFRNRIFHPESLDAAQPGAEALAVAQPSVEADAVAQPSAPRTSCAATRSIKPANASRRVAPDSVFASATPAAAPITDNSPSSSASARRTLP